MRNGYTINFSSGGKGSQPNLTDVDAPSAPIGAVTTSRRASWRSPAAKTAVTRSRSCTTYATAAPRRTSATDAEVGVSTAGWM